MKPTHVNEAGAVHMVDVSAKPMVRRTARARGKIRLQAETLKLIADAAVKKGDVLAVARVAGILAAKKTAELIPLCHNIRIDTVEVDFRVADDGMEIESRVVCTDRTGVEMEALMAVAVAGLTIYDMVKAIDKSAAIERIVLLEKTKDET
jgi:cyclic pyranopterin phosphate synthase